MLDLRTPSGYFFAIIGLMVTATGIFSPESRGRLADVNVNLYAGLFLMAFGGFLLALARRARRRQP